MEDHPTFSPFAIEFEDHRDVTRKYLRSPFSQKTSGNDYNPAIAKKQKAALSLELKRNARKIGKYLKESETVKKLVKVHIDNQNLSGPYLEPRTKFAQEMHKTIQSPVRTLSNAKAESILRSTLNKSNSTLVNTRMTNIDLSNSVDPLSSITVIKDKTLPDILPKDTTPASCKVLTTWTTKDRMDTTITDKIEEGVIVPMETVEFMTLREKKEMVSPSESPIKRRTPSWGTGNLKNFLTKYSYKPKGNAVDKFVDAYCLAMNNKSPRNVETAKPRRMDFRGISFNDSQISKSTMEVEQRYNSQEKSVLEKSTLTKLTTLPQIEEFPVKKIRPRGALYLPKNPPKEELSDSMKTFKELYKSCNKLVSNLNSLDRKLTNRENRLNNKYANLQVRLDKIRDVHFLPQKFVLNEEL